MKHMPVMGGVLRGVIAGSVQRVVEDIQSVLDLVGWLVQPHTMC